MPPKDEPDLRDTLRGIRRRAHEAGVDVRTYLRTLIHAAEERRREDILQCRQASKIKPA